MSAAPRLLLGLAAVAVAFAAADTYVVVLALPDMMESAGVPIDQLQRGAPIVSGFLLGYVAMLPLIGRMADLRGRVPVPRTRPRQRGTRDRQGCQTGTDRPGSTSRHGRR